MDNQALLTILLISLGGPGLLIVIYFVTRRINRYYQDQQERVNERIIQEHSIIDPYNGIEN